LTAANRDSRTANGVDIDFGCFEQPRLGSRRRAICGDRETRRDVEQTTFVAALRERGLFHGSGSLEAWVWRMVVNEARRVAREPRTALEQAGEAAKNGQRR
jgi:DNA-directed RNA polymerase specialized sigma24 family protein